MPVLAGLSQIQERKTSQERRGALYPHATRIHTRHGRGLTACSVILTMSQTQCTEAALFVHLSWKTHEEKPWLADDQVRQAVYQAISTRTRSQLCRTLAIDGTDTEVHAVLRFPASLPISCLARIAMQVAAEAVTQVMEMLYAQQIYCGVWERHFTSQTLNASEAAEAEAYLQQKLMYLERS